MSSVAAAELSNSDGPADICLIPGIHKIMIRPVITHFIARLFSHAEPMSSFTLFISVLPWKWNYASMSVIFQFNPGFL